MNVLLINPPLNTTCPADGAYPMGLAYIGAVLKKKGCGIEVLDASLCRYSRQDVSRFLETNREKFDIYAVSAMVTAYKYSKWLSAEIRRYNPHSLIIAGGSICTAGKLLLENSDFDAICIGEGENVIAQLFEAHKEGGDISSIPNLMVKKGDEVRCKIKPKPVDIDSIPLPAWELFDMERYTGTPYLVNVKTPGITMITSRGCPFECTFCYRNFGRKIRIRKTENIIKEITSAIDRFAIGHIDFLDEIFNSDIEKIKALCSAIIEQKIKITWRCIGRTDFADRESLELMYEAGCRWIGYGIESGSQEMLDRMKKHQEIGDIEKSIRLSREAGLTVTGTFIIGMPGENEKTIEENRQFFRRNNIFNVPFFPVPYPGTSLYDECAQNGLIKDDEEYICLLEKDATELMINLTDMPDEKLIETRENMINEFSGLIPVLEAPSESSENKETKSKLKDIMDSVSGIFRKN